MTNDEKRNESLDEVSNAYIRRITAVLDSLSVSTSQVLIEAGLSESQIAQGGKISRKRQQIFIETALKISKRDDLGLLVGQHVSILDFGSLGYAFVSSPNMRKAWEVFSTYQRIAAPMVNVYCRQEGHHGIISAVEAYPLGELHLYAMEDWLAETLAFFNRFDIDDIKFKEVHVTHVAPAHADLYHELYGCPISFGASANEIVFPAEFLDRPFDMADEDVSELCIRQCAEVLKHLSEDDPVVDAVRRVLLTQPGTTPTLGIVADKLMMSTRTLRRRLNEAGTSYKHVLSDVRLGLGAQYLRSSEMQPKEVAYVLGYSGVTSFHRAFKTKFGMTPVEYRQQFDQ